MLLPHSSPLRQRRLHFSRTPGQRGAQFKPAVDIYFREAPTPEKLFSKAVMLNIASVTTNCLQLFSASCFHHRSIIIIICFCENAAGLKTHKLFTTWLSVSIFFNFVKSSPAILLMGIAFAICRVCQISNHLFVFATL
jgi:hypothetical protein